MGNLLYTWRTDTSWKYHLGRSTSIHDSHSSSLWDPKENHKWNLSWLSKIQPRFASHQHVTRKTEDNGNGSLGVIPYFQSVDFESIIAEGDNSTFENSLEVDTFLSKMESHFHHFDIIHFFRQFPVQDEPNQDESDHFPNGNTTDLVSLLDQFGKDNLISTTQIADIIEWVRAFSTDNSDS